MGFGFGEFFGGHNDDIEKKLTAEQEGLKKIEAGPEQKGEVVKEMEYVKLDERLSESQALIYQDYAARIEGKKFSEQAGKNSYKEAQQLVDILKSNNFDWLNIDWNNVDFDDAVKIESVEKRIDAALREIIKREDPKAKTQLGQWLESTRGMILPFAMATALMIGKADNLSAFDNSKLSPEIVPVETVRETGLHGEHIFNEDTNTNIKEDSERFAPILQRWLSEHPEFVSIELEKVGYGYINGDYTGLTGMKISAQDAQADVMISAKTNDGRLIRTEGSAKRIVNHEKRDPFRIFDEVFEVVEIILNHLPGKGHIEFHAYELDNPAGNRRIKKMAIEQAMKKAIEKYSEKKKVERTTWGDTGTEDAADKSVSEESQQK